MGVDYYYCDDFESPEFYTESVPKARKVHICCECRTSINIGELHYALSGKWDGRVCTIRTCTDCYDERKAQRYDGYFETLWDNLYEKDVSVVQLYLNILIRRKAEEKEIIRVKNILEEIRHDDALLKNGD